MRKEASLELWRELYQIADDIKKAKPWEVLFDTELLCIVPEGADEPVFVSIMGRAGRCFGFTVYEGMDGLADFDMVATADDHRVPMDYVMFEQTSLCCYWGDREEVPPVQKKKITALGLKYRGRGQWPYFESYKRRYIPYTPDEREVQVLIQAGRQILVLVEEMAAGTLRANFDAGDALWRIWDKETGAWRSEVAPQPYKQKEYPMLDLQDEVLKKRLQRRPMVDVCIIMEFAYLNAAIKDEKEDRPLNPLIFMAVDEDEEIIISMNLLSSGEKEEEVALGFFVNYVLQFGRPAAIRARNPWILTALEKMCYDCDVEMYEDHMDLIDTLIADLRTRMQ
ncbi:MAG TPA: hypothetical protein IAB46_08840 [Candidatus Scybalocola faecigallinarum]|uniref:Uncharacterized protein n=1 Tax=Candidatus Scybalocola faecigallinarum TaxID=2840941 RepID=A0A9D1F4Z5_9FIRM|nr:hypothetical protein [Candidatus Scybalocola faecigallinarum]